MKLIPSLHSIERTVRMLPVIKEVFKVEEHVPPESAVKIQQLKDAVHNKKAEICALREKVDALEKENETLKTVIENYNDALFHEDTNETLIKEN